MKASSSALETVPPKINCKDDYGNLNEPNAGSIDNQWFGMMEANPGSCADCTV